VLRLGNAILMADSLPCWILPSLLMRLPCCATLRFAENGATDWILLFLKKRSDYPAAAVEYSVCHVAVGAYLRNQFKRPESPLPAAITRTAGISFQRPVEMFDLPSHSGEGGHRS